MIGRTISGFIFLCFFVETKSNKVKIHGTEYKDAIPNDYIVAINTQKLKNDMTAYKETKVTTAMELQNYLFENIPNSDSLKMKSFIFPNYVVLEVSLKPQYVHLLQEHPLVTWIETNHQVYAYNTLNVTGNTTLSDRTCLRQDTGCTLWGLSRISSRNKVRIALVIGTTMKRKSLVPYMQAHLHLYAPVLHNILAWAVPTCLLVMLTRK